MSKGIRVAAFEGGKIRMLRADDDGNEVVLALPLNRLIVKVVKVPSDADPVEFSAPVLKAMSPYPDDDLSVGVEVMRESETSKTVVAAALPESSAEDIGEALDAEKLSVVKIDSLVFGELRSLWPQIFSSGTDDLRRLLVLDSVDGLSLIVLDGDIMSSVRSVDAHAPLKREALLGLLEAEELFGAKELHEILFFKRSSAEKRDESEDSGQTPPEEPVTKEFIDGELSCFAAIRELSRPSGDSGLSGIAERAQDPSTLDVLPASWREVLEETRFKAKLAKWMAFSAMIWLLAVGVLFGVPFGYRWLAGREKDKCRRHAKSYREVSEMKSKVKLVKKYSDHSAGALAVLKAVSDRLPDEGVVVERFNFKFDDSVVIAAVADTSELAYEFHSELERIMLTDGDDEKRLFEVVTLKDLKPKSGKSAEQSFTIVCAFHKEEDMEQ